jgi:hypothetical protein
MNTQTMIDQGIAEIAAAGFTPNAPTIYEGCVCISSAEMITSKSGKVVYGPKATFYAAPSKGGWSIQREGYIA